MSVRRYVQDQAGGLQNLVIPENSIEQLILVAPVGKEDRLVVEGSYIVDHFLDIACMLTIEKRCSNRQIKWQLEHLFERSDA